MQLLDQMVEVVGEEEVTLDKFSKIMQLGFKEHKMGFIPQTLHQVIVSSVERLRGHNIDRKSTRLNSSHANISYAVFCLKKKINLIIVAKKLITNQDIIFYIL